MDIPAGVTREPPPPPGVRLSELDNDPRDDHNHAPKVIKELQSPRLRAQAAREKREAPIVDDIGYYGQARTAKGRAMAFAPKQNWLPDDGLEPESDRQYSHGRAVPREHRAPTVARRDGAIADLQERQDRQEATMSEILKEIRALRQGEDAPKPARKSRSSRGKSRARADPDSMVSPNAE